MNSHNMRILALVYAQVALLEAMKAENQNRESRGAAQAYDEAAFMTVSYELERLSNSFDDGATA